MVRLIDIPVEPLTDDAFEPYGSIIAELPPGVPRVYGTKPAKVLKFTIDGSARLAVVRFPLQAMEFCRLERHVLVTETRVPLIAVPTVMVVAPPTPEGDIKRYPDEALVRAFLLNGQQGVLLHAGTWHGLDCFPVARSHVDFLVISEARTEDEWILGKDPAMHKYSDTVDFLEHCMTSFRVVDRANVLWNLESPSASGPVVPKRIRRTIL